MKYPQLVSTRAVNALSDWLVSRLEQLGVEAPQIYTRLLLSLLQSSVQINDPIEFNSLETFIGNRKGGSIKRYLQCDANTLKKLNAVQCLSEIVSSEQELTTIENLVDELWEKLKDIEKQLDYSYGDETISIDYSANTVETNETEQLVENVDANTNLANNCNNNKSKNNNIEKRSIVSGDNNNTKKELETDPKKRYFNAFPALSKEMEDSFRIWRRNSKSLTWPADKCRGNMLVTSINSTGSNLSCSLESRPNTKSAKTTDKSHDLNALKLDNASSHAIASSTEGLKRKTKRRKSQSMSKGRAMRKTAFNDNVINAFSTTGSAGNNRKSNRHVSPTQWDTDFDGYWEMGRDLIKEFFAKQSDKNENRCNSANGAYSIKQNEDMDITKFKHNSTGSVSNNDTDLIEKTRSPPPLMPPVDISFCYDDSIDDDTYKSIAELTADNSINNSRSSPRRLYQRLVLPENDYDVEPSSKPDVNSDFVQFKSKFNSNIAALWENNSDDENSNYGETSLWSAPSNIPWPTVAPIKENLKTFWTNFYNYQFDLAKIPQEQNDFAEMDANSCTSLPYVASSSSNLSTKTNNGIEFHSMPYSLEGFDKPDGTVSNNNRSFKKPDGRKTPIGVFLQDSIWSENLNGGKNTDTDESFYLKVWNSNKKLYNLDAVYDKKIIEPSNKSKQNDSSFQFSNYGASKWSEGINAGPNALLQQKNMNRAISNYNQQNLSSSDCTDASVSTTTSCSSSTHTLSSSGIFSGQTPSLQSCLQTNENARSLSEVYGMNSMNSPINDDCQKMVENMEQISPISLPNHSTESSGFVEYSRIKSTLKLENIKQQQRNYQDQIIRPKVQNYPDDENLLTSERTHFQPIRAYADGYTFDVCSSLEVINYKRSNSGYLYYESEKYLEYTRKDSFMAEEEGNVAISTAPLYAGSNCDAAISQKRKRERKAEELVLKFRITNREIACQTDDEATIDGIYATAHMQHPLYLIFSGAATDGIKIPTTGQACSNAIDALNKAVAAAAKAAAERDRVQLVTPWLNLNEIIDNSRNAVGSSLIWTAVQASPREDIGVDVIDFCNESSCNFGNNMNQQWSIHEIENRCQLNGGVCHGEEIDESHNRNTNSENNNLIGMQQNNADMHSLWGMCAACNSDYKSAPANNLLRDELKLEADEIMSDLKNMQDLYIGCDTAAQSENSDNECSNSYFWGKHGNEHDRMPKNLKHPYPIALAPNSGIEDDEDTKIHDWEEDQNIRQKETQKKVLQQVNKLIADLMRPEKANDTNLLADAAASAHRELGESLWPDDGGHNIWKQQFEPCNNGRNVASQYEKGNFAALIRSSRNSDDRICDEEKKFLAQLTWEHDNLAELWAKSTPPPNSNKTSPQRRQFPHRLPLHTPPEKPPVIMCSIPNDDACLRHRRNGDDIQTIQHDAGAGAAAVSVDTDVTSSTVGSQQKEYCDLNEHYVSNENRNNLSNCNDIQVAAASTAAYKRIQQFLSSTGVASSVTTAKLKLSNRKRRHSASQNYAIFHNNGLGGGNAIYASNQKSNNKNNNNNNNNNNFKLSDLNNYNFKRIPSVITTANINSNNANNNSNILTTNDRKSDATIGIVSDDVDMLEQNFDDSAAYFLIKNGDNMILPPPKQTIITCKYWTTIDPIITDTDVIDCAEGTTFSCLVDKNDTILKHVTMLARPLTR